MTTRIDTKFAELKAEGRPALVTYFMGGDPDLETSLKVMKALPKAGADVIELGMPFSDPMADGPAIQAAGLRALNAGQTLAKTLHMAAEFRKEDDTTPIVMMGYYNPIYIYGVERFLADAKASGVDGLIVVDLPSEMDAELCIPAMKAGINFIRLTTPTTDDKRLPKVLHNSSGFVYYVSMNGITGSAIADTAKVGEAVRHIKRAPICRSVSVSASRRRSRQQPSPPTPMASSSARRLSTRLPVNWTKTARQRAILSPLQPDLSTPLRRVCVPHALKPPNKSSI